MLTGPSDDSSLQGEPATAKLGSAAKYAPQMCSSEGTALLSMAQAAAFGFLRG